jgi:hypothetical protein
MAVVAVILLFSGVFPEVKDPWPSSIGLDFPFAVAGAFGVLASARSSEKSDAERSREINKAGVAGFRLGVGLYVLSFLNQLTFGL